MLQIIQQRAGAFPEVQLAGVHGRVRVGISLCRGEGRFLAGGAHAAHTQPVVHFFPRTVGAQAVAFLEAPTNPFTRGFVTGFGGIIGLRLQFDQPDLAAVVLV